MERDNVISTSKSIMALRKNTDESWLDSEIEKRLEATIEKLDEPPLVVKGKRKSKTY